jgi:nucleoside phosphorylase
LSRFRNAELTWKESNVDFCLMLSGPDLIDNVDHRTELLEQFPEAKGGEMEGVGLYAAAEGKAQWIIVKAVCDWADGNKGRNKKKSQALAAKNAATFVLHALTQGGFARS